MISFEIIYNLFIYTIDIQTAIVNNQQLVEDDLDQNLDYNLYEEIVSYILFSQKINYSYLI
jgi:hypothetical protein